MISTDVCGKYGKRVMWIENIYKREARYSDGKDYRVIGGNPGRWLNAKHYLAGGYPGRKSDVHLVGS